MAIGFKKEESVILFSQDNLHLRVNADAILASNEVLSRLIDPRSLPIAGLRSAVYEAAEKKSEFFPEEILNPEYQPVIIVDLDDTSWPHVHYLLRAVSHVTGIEATENDVKKYGHTRNIPQWQTDEIARMQDAIQANRHPDVNPFVNRADQHAVETLHAVHRMGHLYTYLTGRMSEMYDITKRVIQWNGMPHDGDMKKVDARKHIVPKRGYLYCSPCNPKEVDAYKHDVVTTWLKNLRAAGWKGQMVIIDDTPKAFEEEICRGDVMAIALEGLLNYRHIPFTNEMRVNSWHEISAFLSHIHGQAVQSDPNKDRVFSCGPTLPGMYMSVRKDVSGPGYFRFTSLPAAEYKFFPKDGGSHSLTDNCTGL
ncbi:MAG: hypothetical protein NT149_00065 [Candidatus Gottesmanbacteria bacterium]|nr:hypothetical protein [Candidatus Gottesmanbacteria bacterium]